jgi:hypothetical protein
VELILDFDRQEYNYEQFLQYWKVKAYKWNIEFGIPMGEDRFIGMNSMFG